MNKIKFILITKKCVTIISFNIIISISVLFLYSCASNNINTEFPQFSIPDKVKLGAGDEIQVKFRLWPDLDETQTIRSDGKISLQRIGDVQAAGLNVEEIKKKLIELYASEIKEPDIFVIVRSLAKQHIYVSGEVKNPGIIQMPYSYTIMEAVAAAGGYNKYSAKLSKVKVFRQRGDKSYAQIINMKEMLNKPQYDLFYLEPNDIVFVPRTTIDRIDQWVDQYIRRLLPISLGSVGSVAGP